MKRLLLATAACILILARSAAAQGPTEQAPSAPAPQPAPEAAPDPNPGPITFTGNFDVMIRTPYIFRGFVQETDPQTTMWPSADIGIALHSGTGALKTASLNFGVWNSLQTGSSGLGGPNEKLHYEEDFYAALGLGFSKGTFTTTYTAYTSPNSGFSTVHELAFKGAFNHKIAPYFVLAQELGEVGADGPNKKGTYIELGVGPSWALAGTKATLAIPLKLGLSAHNYYELDGKDNKFGFFDLGALVTIPMTHLPASYGAWNFHFGGDVLAFGDTTKYYNEGKSFKGLFLFGVGVSY